jgi:UDP-N-acetylmuramoyl-L-alanyl-D-glutamate--2,6-diaminopimelate ligase
MTMVEERRAVASSRTGVPLGSLLAEAGVGSVEALDAGLLAERVTGVHFDSRDVADGGIFVAVPGERLDGARFAEEACARGAALVVAQVEPPVAAAGPWIRVPDPRAALAALSAAFHGNPSHGLLVVGVTGTNGKTTTTYLLESIFEHAGMATGRITSITNRVGRDDSERQALHTTPEAPVVQGLLGEMRDRGSQACVMEVSSHAVALRRVDHVSFDAAVFTNLTRDHLDFHGDMGRYFAAKRRLFEMLPDHAPAVINVDDAYGDRLAASVSRPVTYALDRPADCRPDRLDLRADGTFIQARTRRGSLRLESPLIGRAAACNVLAAATAAVALDLPFEGIEAGVRELTTVPGRMQTVSSTGDDLMVIVDSAHTDDALRSLLEAVRSLAARRVVTVFGCGGDRDATKRPLMGVVSTRLSDRVILTSDNPRSEDPDAIIDDIERGIRSGDTPYLAIADRREAIARAIEDAAPGDTVVIAGKGHEQYQVIGSRAVPFSDVVVARAALDARRARSNAG